MSNLSAKELEVAALIVDSLNLEDITAEEIEPNAPLFRDGLGLDSLLFHLFQPSYQPHLR